MLPEDARQNPSLPGPIAVDAAPTGLLLDFGNVICNSLFEMHAHTETVLGLPAGSLKWLGPLDPATDPLWLAMEKGELTEREYWGRRAMELGQACGEDGWDVLKLETVVRGDLPEEMFIRPEMANLISSARAKGIRIGILTNELELFHGKECLMKLQILGNVDVMTDCSYTNYRKPQLIAYEAAVRAMEMAPRQILFVDDQIRNIVGGNAAGLQTLHFDIRDVPGCVAAIAARMGLQETARRSRTAC